MKAIVYTSNTGYTKAYAKLLEKETGLPVYSLEETKNALPKGTEIIYMRWHMASNIRGYKVAAKRYKVRAVVGVGLCETGCLIEECRKATKIPAEVPFFTVQGGMDHSKLHGINKFMIDMLVKMLDSKKDKGEDDIRMLVLIKKGGDYVSADNLAEFLGWYEGEK